MTWKIITLFLIAIALGGASGWMLSEVNAANNAKEFSKRKAEFQDHLLTYKPSCNELNQLGVHNPVKLENEIVILEVKDNYFNVYGFSSGIQPPVSGWWGSEKRSYIAYYCKQNR